MTTILRFCALSLAIAATPAWAQEDEPSSATTKKNSWRENAVTRCVQQYSAEQCQNEEFLEENFHVNSLEIAHRAAIRRNQSAEKAMREVILQYACNDSPKEVCEGNQSAQCIAEVTQTCAKLKRETAACVQHAKQGCVSTADPGTCFQQHKAQCPSEKKQPIAQLLSKYPNLSASQKAQLMTTAQTLEKKTRGWWSNLVSWISTPLN